MDTAVAGSTTPTQPRERMSPDEVVVIIVLALGVFVMILDELAMGVALPQVMDELDMTAGAGSGSPLHMA